MTLTILHLGVHKTATTHVQSRLYNSMDELNDAGIGYLGLDDTRRMVTSQIRKSHAKVESSSELKEFLEGYNDILLSDENFLGGTSKPENSILYEDAPKRLKAVLNSISADNISLHLTIRDPESYLVSRYCEFLRHYKFMPIHEYLDALFLREFSWLPLIRAIEHATGQQVHVSTFERMFEDEQQYFDTLLGRRIQLADATDNPHVKRSKVSNEAYEILLETSKHFPGHVIRKLMNMMTNNKQFTKKTPLKPFGESLSAQLKENYEQDKKALGLA